MGSNIKLKDMDWGIILASICFSVLFVIGMYFSVLITLVVTCFFGLLAGGFRIVWRLDQ